MQFVVYETYPKESVSSFTDLKLPREEGIFIAEGEKIVGRLLQSKQEIISLYMTAEHFQEKRDLIEAHQQGMPAPIFIASKKAMEKIVGFTLHQGILAAANIPPERPLRQLILPADRQQLFILLDAITDAENTGTLYRTAQAMGATAIVLNEQSISPWIRRAVRVSMGAVFSVPTVTTDLKDAIQLLQASSVQVYAATISNTARSLAETDLRKSVAIVFGSEGPGISDAVLEICQQQVMIPMKDGVSSLNVAIAQGIVLYEVMRQRMPDMG